MGASAGFFTGCSLGAWVMTKFSNDMLGLVTVSGLVILLVGYAYHWRHERETRG